MWSKRSPKFVEKWRKVRTNGVAHFVFTYGVLRVGGLFACLMLVSGFVFSDKSSLALSTYFLTGKTWFLLVFNALVYGILMGTFFWYTNEVAYKSQIDREENDHPNV